ncbi:hypothetical protein P691DRAFT_767319 [Macrolepiota fuliginosa MF-IS2]|uniref:Uncharacterized protein n=1 Tax=Macrolepiota fuliginosa MF-IS2 TaxID=1400762 RepID=A0A9P5WX63_9AGAR|nr:hypothetical protein P691DRAFT_767319 [Macrolepiota fuliginosa MF-IS2]
MPPKKTALCFKNLTVQQWEELMQEYIAQHSSMGDAGSEGMEVDVDNLGEVAKCCQELEGSQVAIQEKGKKKAKAKWVEMSEEEGNYPGTNDFDLWFRQGLQVSPGSIISFWNNHEGPSHEDHY